MSGSRNALAGFGFADNPIIDGLGASAALSDRRQMHGIRQREIEDEEALRAATPGILSGDVDATQRAMAINPQRVDRVRGVVNAQEDRQRSEQEQTLQGLGRASAALLNLPPEQRAQAWPRVRSLFPQFNLPEQPPSDTELQTVLGAVQTPQQNAAVDAARPRLGAPIGGGAAPAAAGPFTPPAGDELDFMARMIHMESNGQGEQGMAAVGHTILNRARLSGRPVRDIITAPSQFEPWGNPQARQQMMTMTPEQYAAARRVAEEVVTGRLPDPTEGATHFLNPDLQRRLGRSQPAWAPEGQGQRIGAHVFYRIPQDFQRAGGPAQGNAQPAAAEGGIPPGARPVLDRDGLPVIRNGNEVFVLGDGPNRQVFQRPVQRAPQQQQNNIALSPGQQIVNPRTGEVIARNETPTASQNRDGRLSTRLEGMDDDDIKAVRAAEFIRADIAALRRLITPATPGAEPALPLGGATNLGYRFTNATGVGLGQSQQAANFATLQATLERIRGNTLLLAKGTQTEGDALRAMAQILESPNNATTAEQRFADLLKEADRVSATRMTNMNRRRTQAGAQPISLEDIGLPTQASVSQDRGALGAPQRPPRVTNDAEFDALPSGATFIDPEGRTRRKP